MRKRGRPVIALWSRSKGERKKNQWLNTRRVLERSGYKTRELDEWTRCESSTYRWARAPGHWRILRSMEHKCNCQNQQVTLVKSTIAMSSSASPLLRWFLLADCSLSRARLCTFKTQWYTNITTIFNYRFQIWIINVEVKIFLELGGSENSEQKNCKRTDYSKIKNCKYQN